MQEFRTSWKMTNWHTHRLYQRTLSDQVFSFLWVMSVGTEAAPVWKARVSPFVITKALTKPRMSPLKEIVKMEDFLLQVTMTNLSIFFNDASK